VTLFARAFLLIALLTVTAILASFQIYRVYEREPRSRELAQQTVSTVNLTRAALVNADPVLRRQLLIELNDTEGLRVFPVTASEKVEALPDDPLLERVAQKVRETLGAETRFAYAHDGEDGFWVVECPGLPGCVSQGQSREEAIVNIRRGDRGLRPCA